jgi:hypothetical protein
MRPPLVLAVLIVFLAVLIGCKRKPNTDEGQATEPGDRSGKDGSGNTESTGKEPPGTAAGGQTDLPPPWPPLPEVPPRPKSFPTTPGGTMAWALDAAAENLIVHGSPEKETYDTWVNYSFRRAFGELDKAIAEYPRAKLDKEVYGPAGNATKERELLDKTFARFFAAWTQYWEQHRRWEIEKSEVFLRQLRPKAKAKDLRADAERSHPPGHEVRLDSGNLATLAMGKYDWYRLDASGTEKVEWRAMGGGWVTGRVEFNKSLTIATGPMAVVLSGSAGEGLILQAGGPAVIDLVEFNAPLVRIDCGEDLLVRVGPGVQKLQIDPRRGVVLARGAPNLRVLYHADRHPVAIVGY